jgi:CBS domain-containing protein
MGLMASRNVRHLIVRRRGEIIGLVSIGDLVKALIDEQEVVITSMDHYIRSAP